MAATTRINLTVTWALVAAENLDALIQNVGSTRVFLAVAQTAPAADSLDYIILSPVGASNDMSSFSGSMGANENVWCRAENGAAQVTSLA
jgi:hypothetical protein